MTKRERVLAAIEHRPTDRFPKWLGIPTQEALPKLYEAFHVHDLRALKLAANDDIWEVEMPYHSPSSDAIYAAFNFSAEKSGYTLTDRGFFADFSDDDDIGVFNWPDPSLYIDPTQCRRRVDEVPEGYAVMGVIWNAHFQDACAAFGMEEALMKMKTDPQLFQAVIDRILQFYLQANKIFYEATRGKLDMVLIGNDFGTQESLICSPDDLRRFVFGGTKALIDQAHEYGLKVIHHSCGSIKAVIPDIIACGADVIHPIQALAKNMDPQGLKDAFGGQVAFCGGVDTQQLLVHGTPDEVRAAVKRLEGIFQTGYIVSPSHEAILPDINPHNVVAMME